jgi:hypothetical protein
MLEEKGGWVFGEAQRHDVEMMDVVLEGVAKASKQTLERVLNPFKEQLDEILPPNLETEDFNMTKRPEDKSSDYGRAINNLERYT